MTLRSRERFLVIRMKRLQLCLRAAGRTVVIDVAESFRDVVSNSYRLALRYQLVTIATLCHAGVVVKEIIGNVLYLNHRCLLGE